MNSNLIIKFRKENIGIFFVYLYILFSYIAPSLALNIRLQQISLYALLMVGGLAVLFNIKRFKLLNYYIWYGVLIFVSLISCMYALDSNVAFNSIYNLLVVLGIAVSITVLIKNKKDIENILICFSASGFLLFIILLFTNQLIVNERLGHSLFGNPNTFASMLMISLICSIWLLLKKRGYKKSIYLIVVLAQFYMLFLSGGRKFVLFPLLFLYLLLILNVKRKKKIKMIQYTIAFGVILAIGYWIIFNVPQFYNSIGFRMESLINLVTGQGLNSFDIGRQDMILYGIDFWTQKPVLGYGINNYQILFGRIFGAQTYSHNNYIEMLVNLGMLGFITYYSYYIILIRSLWNKKVNSLGLKNFFLAYIICLLPFELGAVTYDLIFIQIFIALISSYLFLEYKDSQKEMSIK